MLVYSLWAHNFPRLDPHISDHHPQNQTQSMTARKFSFYVFYFDDAWCSIKEREEKEREREEKNIGWVERE